MLTKYAKAEILDVRQSGVKLSNLTENLFQKLAKPQASEISEDGFLYVRVRAISSRVNKNNDGWPSEELAKAYSTFEGRPIFVDHNNDDPERTRGVVVWSKLHVEDEEKVAAFDAYYASAPDNHKPPTWIELMLEVDAEEFPKLANAIIAGDIDAVSMGANIETSICSVCENEAQTPAQYCSHVKSKGVEFEIESANGERVKKKAYEDCHGINFFEISFVFDPADETADVLDKTPALAKTAGSPDNSEAWEDWACADCGAVGHENVYEAPEGGFECRPCGTPVVSKTAEKLHHDLKNRGGDPGDSGDGGRGDKERQLNHEPQSEKLRAPQDVDTLRPDVVCKNCGTEMEEDSTGVFSCPECGLEQEPEGFDNPDLEKAQETDIRQETEEIVNEEGEVETEMEAVAPEDEDEGNDLPKKNKPVVRPVNPVQPMAMRVAASVETRLGSPTGIHPLTLRALEANGLQARITFLSPSNKQPVASFDLPTASPQEIMIAQRQAARTEAGRIPREDLPILVEAADDAALQMAVAVIQSGGYEALPENQPTTSAVIDEMNFEIKTEEKISAEGKTVRVIRGLFTTAATDKKVLLDQPESKRAVQQPKEKVISDQLAPVESSETNKDSNENMDKTADREVIKRVEEDGSGVKRTEEIIKEFGPLGEDNAQPEGEADADPTAEADESAEPKAESEEEPKAEGEDEAEAESEPHAVDMTQHNPLVEDKEKEPAMASVDKEAKLFEAMKLARMASSLGVISSNDEFEFVADLEGESMEQITARKDMLERVKNAGLSKASKRTTVAGRFPSLKVAHNGASSSIDDLPDEAAFI